MKRGVILTGLGTLSVLLFSYSFIFANKAQIFRNLESFAPGACVALPGFYGPEDIVVDPETGFAYITTADRHNVAQGLGGPKGNIARLDLRAALPTPVMLTPRNPDDFFPHGLDFHRDENGVKRLYAVNHWADETRHSIDSFLITETNELKLETSFEADIISSPNDVTVVEPGVFFTTNDMGARTSLGATLESYLMIPWSNVVLYKDGEATKIVEGLRYGNGVLYDAKTERLYVAESTGQKVSAYHFDNSHPQLELLWTLSIPMALDNLSMAADGSLLVTGHPKIFKFLAHADNPALPAPSEVVRISNLDGDPQWKTIFLDNGENIAAAPIAVAFEGRLFIGAVFDDHLLMCDL